MLTHKHISGIIGIVCMLLPLFSICYAQNTIDPNTDLVYKGAFRLPDQENNNHSWDWGGSALGFLPHGDPGGGGDGYPGSLVSAGKRDGGNYKRDVSEFTIPVPVISDDMSQLPKAKTLQPFTDITDGKFEEILGGTSIPHMRGLCYLPPQGNQANGKLYFSFWDGYNTGNHNFPSQGYCDTDFSNLNRQGVWRGSTTLHNKNYAGYLLEIPEAWANQYVGGRRLGVGQKRSGSAFGRGPSLVAIDPYNYTESSPPTNDTMDGINLLWYPKEYSMFPDTHDNDYWGGGAWIESDGKSAVMIAGKKAGGHSWYGEATQDGYTDPCSSSKGYHASEYIPQMIFYDPADLAAVAQGKKESWEVVPYATLNLREIFPKIYQCFGIAGVAYDRSNNILYLIHRQDGTKPIVQVFKVKSSSPNIPSIPSSKPKIN